MFGVGEALAQEKLQVWFTKAFYPAEDKALQDVIKKFEDRTGVKIELSLFSPEDVVTKSVSAVEAGTPPDVGFGLTYDFRVTGKWAFEGKLEDISDVIKPLEAQYLPGPLSTTMLLNGKTGQKAYYAAPVEMQLMHINYWIDMLQDAGFKESDIPNQWKPFWDFWCDKVQGALRAKGQRVFGIGHPASVQASDTFYSFHMFMNAYNVEIVDDAGKLLLDQPKNRQGLARALADYANIVSRGCSPASSVNWTDVDNNLNFANKTTVLTHNATISIPAAQFDTMNYRADATPEQKAAAKVNYYERIRTRGFPDKPEGGKLPQLAAVKTAVIFGDAKNKKRAKEFLAFFLLEENLQTYVEGSLGRWVPVTKKASAAPFWTDGTDPHRRAVYQQVQEGIVFFPFTKNWKFTIINAENVWGRATARIAKDGIAPDKAADELIDRVKQILAN
jgi:multiple sugar transport system substrate-binding protein